MKKSRTVSFRVPEDIITEIEKEARTNLTSTNVLINQILLQYVSWDKFEHRMKMFPVAEDLLHYILDNLDESQRKEAIEITFNAIRDWALISKKKFDIHSCLQVLEDYCRMVGISVEESTSSGTRSFVIRHNLGRKASIFIEELVEKIFWEIVKIKVDFDSTSTTVIVKLQSKFD
jgi:hypothetical protein